MKPVQIDINLVWQIINFLILVLIFNKYMKKPLNKILEERKNTIVKDLTAAEEANKTAQTMKVEMEEALKAAKNEAKEIIHTAEKKAFERQEAILKDAQAQRDKTLKAAEVEIEKMKVALKNELTATVRETAAAMAAEIVSKKLDSQAKDTLINEFISEVGEVKW